MDRNKRRQRRQYAEDFGLLFERMGIQPMAGRIWGWLLTAEPPHQSAAQIAEALACSRSSVSTMTGLLMQVGLVERVAIPGRRSRFYRAVPGGFARTLRNRMRITSEIRKMAERGLELVSGKRAEGRRVLEEYRDCARFFEREFPALIEQWERERGTR